MNIRIDPEFQALIPPLSNDERRQLEENLIENGGARDPLVVWTDAKDSGVIVDGHNRYEICKRRGLKFNIEETEFTSRDAAIVWIIDNQMGRRNLAPIDAVRLAERKRPIIEAWARERMSMGGGDKRSGKENLPDPIENQGQTRDHLAKQAGVSPRTYEKLAKVIEKGTPELNEAVKEKKVSADCAAVIAEMDDEDQVEIVSLETKKEIVAEVKKRAHVANNSGENEWYTPPEFIEAARTAMGGIDTDPASCELANNTVKATAFYSKDDDGLTKEWRGRVWMNPPYAQPLIAQFCETLTKKWAAREFSEACVLVNNATETAWCHGLLKDCTAVCFIRSRIKFLDKEGNKAGAPLQGQVVVYFGDRSAEFSAAFSGIGVVLFR